MGKLGTYQTNFKGQNQENSIDLPIVFNEIIVDVVYFGTTALKRALTVTGLRQKQKNAIEILTQQVGLIIAHPNNIKSYKILFYYLQMKQKYLYPMRTQ